MDFSKLKTILAEKKEPLYRYSQIASEVSSGRAVSFDDIFTIPIELRSFLAEKMALNSLQELTVFVSKDKNAYKALLQLQDGNSIETVLMNPSPNLWSVCLSSQVGCPMGCAFCATGKQGLKRNLSAEEICDQFLFWKQYISKHKLKIRISNIVYMGMGEPFLNSEYVFESIRWLINPQMYGLGQRHISVSTCGIVPVISQFANQFPQANLAISLHAPEKNLRKQLMPVENLYPLPQLMVGLQKYVDQTNRQLFFEYVMLSGINDTDKSAISLGNLLRSSFQSNLHLVHVNLIPFNATGSHFVPSSELMIKRFEEVLKQFHISVSVRRSLGQDIEGACGQLKQANSHTKSS